MPAQFNSYTADQFIENPDFIRWIKNRSEEDEAFWQQWKATNPPNLKEFETAELRLSAILSAGSYPETSDYKEEVWDRIQSSIEKNRHVIRPLFTRWLAAASVILIVIAAIWFWSNNGKQKTSIVTNANKEKLNDIAPGGNKAVLTLADGSTIILDSAQNGLLSQQGNAKVIKLDDGKLAYQKGDSRETKIQYNTITTPRGGQYQLVLADGSHVWLNAASSITFPTVFAGNKREVKITGEAYFEVAHNAPMPFHVSVNKMEVEVLGTHFNVNAYEDEGVIKTTLLKGSVKVSEGNKSVLIKPGEQAQIKNSTENISIKKDVNLGVVVAWKNGLFQFDGANLKAIMRQAARWYDVDVIYEGKTDETFSGSTQRSEHISHLLKILEATGKVAFQINGNQIIVKSK